MRRHLCRNLICSGDFLVLKRETIRSIFYLSGKMQEHFPPSGQLRMKNLSSTNHRHNLKLIARLQNGFVKRTS